jgi:hypothetical protein
MILLLSLFSAPGFAYGEKVHARLTTEALAPAVGTVEVTPATAEQVSALLAGIDTFARENAVLSPAWAERYPLPGRPFDAWELKQLLMLSPDATVYGIDQFDAESSRIALLSVSSRRPDDDFRNRDRFAHGPDRAPIANSPDDPAILNMGTLGALSSQAHAHYGLDQLEFSDDSKVLQEDPPRFAVPFGWPDGPVLTFAAEMCQAHLDLGLLAALDGNDALATAYTGQAFHYLEDVGNPIHTVQVGLYDFFKDAFFQRLGISVLTGGGHFGELPTLGSLGVGILSNHHTISEQLTEKKMLAGDQRLLNAMTTDDTAFLTNLPTDSTTEFGFAAVRTLIHTSAPDGAPMYAATRAIVHPRFRKWKVSFDDKNDDPETALKPGATEAEMQTFWALQERSLGRAGTALRRVWALQEEFITNARSSPEALLAARELVATRFLQRSLRLRGEADARRATYEASPPASASAPEKQTGVLIGEVVAAGAVMGGVGWAIRRKRPG